MHGTACAPGYPSDSTRSLAGVGPQDELRAADRTATARAQRGGGAVTPTPWTLLAGRAGAGRARRPAASPASPDAALDTPHPRRRHLRRGGCR